ncbi:MAG: ion transporter [Methylobacter tundripaludum]|uniref:Voltage-gated potassium channel n=1 Tax=Methylobacter tundripaludum TaxID=173365 RepID=A0A2S6H3L2_9GAMM|nr:ion transporter [Methylobacter tundripaludum]MCK9635375.1 ion transporter [Methylobacter tundripaludum]PPK72065.1 voltage-gated potassium channel [Methylobacter tundripaludum]
MNMRKTAKIKPHYNQGESLSPWRESLNDIIFGSETRKGKAFDTVLSVCIMLSVSVVMLESIDAIHRQYTRILDSAEWIFTVLFTVEYGLRLISVRRPWLYAKSFFGMVDLLAILPTYLIVLIPGGQGLMAIRVLRLLRIFRIFKLSEYLAEAHIMVEALTKSARKITVFLYAILMLVVVFGSLMYVVESGEAGFTSIPVSIYWAVVTLTTVGYGDISPQTPLGQLLASTIMIVGYGIIAVPTGIYSAELIKTYSRGKIRNDACPDCGETGHDFDAAFCKYCGHQLDDF